MIIFLYVLKNPDTNEIRYVGKTKNSLNKRLYEHCTVRNLEPKTHKNFWIKSIIKLNKRPLIELLEICNENNWKEREIFWISNIGNLTNSTLGGEGSLGFTHKPETIRKIIESKRRNGTLARSKECRDRIGKAQRGKTHSKEQTEFVASFLRKEILQFDLENNLINEWKGIRYCARKLNFNRPSIDRCLKGKQKSYKNFIWKYK